MNKKKNIIAILFSLVISTSLSAQSKDFNTIKSLEIQLNILKEISANYVDSVQVDKLIKKGIDAMLESLDPYTIHIPEEDEESLEILTTGAYGGVGAIIKKVSSGSIIITEPYEGTPAAKAGLVAGDTIVKIDTFFTKELKVEECSAKMKGKPGTEVKFTVNKLRGAKQIELTLTRERVHISDLEYAKTINDSIAYFKVSGFTLGGAKEIRKAFFELKSQSNLKRVILDLRGNGGGILDEAVELVSLFVPRGTLVVYSKGKISQMDMKYYTKDEPLDTLIPLVVLVNSASASSSEIVAGALQDLDRALIVGTRTFGKGLVQSIREVGYNDKIKITTAKYYIPSGRCVQAIDYSHRNQDGSVGQIPDSLTKEFKTLKKGRVVKDGGGITPDIYYSSDQFSRPALSMIYNDIFLNYSILFFKNRLSIPLPEEFQLTDSEYEDFVNFASKLNFDNRTASEVEFDQLLILAKRENLYKSFEKEINDLGSKIKLSKREILYTNKEEIKSLLEEEICNRYYFQKGRIASIIKSDKQLKRAITVGIR